jgi:hypothetical protein
MNVKVSLRAGLACAALVVTTAVYAAVKCSIDESSAYFTGVTKTDSATGKLLYEYKCARGHVFWSTRSS